MDSLVESSYTKINDTKKDIKIAAHAGFCYGVKRAVDICTKTKEDFPDIEVNVLGELIHNNQVIEHLKDLGINTLNDIPEDIEGVCLIRTHGVAPQLIEKLEQKGCRVINATCPDVKAVQEKAQSLAKEDYRVVIIGKPSHPEVIAIKAHAEINSKNKALVISPDEHPDYSQYKSILREAKKVGVVVQTTQTNEVFKDILGFIAENTKELKVYNTICSATCKRQNEAVNLAKEVELMVVIGSKKSANTTHLAQIVSPITTTIHIETKDELDHYEGLINKVTKVGVTAGASTPDFIINDVINKLNKGE